ncbi:MAG: beta-ketoacyl synthase N-terminal-like domain-containing protein [Planctomycetota bacterium]
MRRVVLTGLGTIGPHGSGTEPLAAALRSGDAPLQSVEPCSLHGANSAGLALYQQGELTPWLAPRAARRLSPSSKYAVAAARQALQHAGVDDSGGAEQPRTSVRLGVSFGPSSVTESLLEQILRGNPQEASPMLFMESVANAPAGQVAMALDLRGPNAAIAQREAAGLLAFVGGVSDVTTGRCDRALVGAVDEVTSLTHGILDRFDALARPTEDLPEGARPFSGNRNGMLLSEGCTVIVLEDEESAKRRGAPILARVAAAVRANDPTAPASSWGRGGARLAKSLRRRLDAAGVDIASIDCVVSGAAGSVRGDRLEASTLRALWGEQPLPRVVAPKSVTGEYGGGFLAAAVLASGGAPVAPPKHFEVDPRLRIDLRDPRHEEASNPRRTLVSALAAGGAAAWIVLER